MDMRVIFFRSIFFLLLLFIHLPFANVMDSIDEIQYTIKINQFSFATDIYERTREIERLM